MNKPLEKIYLQGAAEGLQSRLDECFNDSYGLAVLTASFIITKTTKQRILI